MFYFLSENIPEKKNLEISLSYIYGIGRKESIKICQKLGLNSKMYFKDLSNQSLNNLKIYIEFNYVFGFHLKRFKNKNIENLKKIRTYKGNRHFLGYLVRGQRSRNKKSRKHSF